MSDVGAVPRFRHQLHEGRRLIWLSVQLAWRASPRLALGVLLLLLVQALLPSLNLVLYRLGVDRAAPRPGPRIIHDPPAAPADVDRLRGGGGGGGLPFPGRCRPLPRH